MNGDAIHYTTDGTNPTPESPCYSGHLTFNETVTVLAASFRERKQISLVSEGHYVLLPPRPIAPSVYLDALPFRASRR
jgi:hypothetical protein